MGLNSDFGRLHDYPLFVAPLDNEIVVLCGSNPSLTAEAARETARLLIEAADRLNRPACQNHA